VGRRWGWDGMGWDGMGRRVILKGWMVFFYSPPVLLSRQCGAKSELAARERSKREDWREQWRWVGCKVFFLKSLFGKLKSGEVGVAHWEPAETMVPVCVPLHPHTNQPRPGHANFAPEYSYTTSSSSSPPKIIPSLPRYGVQAPTLLHLEPQSATSNHFASRDGLSS